MRLLRILLVLALSSCTGLVVEGADTTDAAGSETTSGADDSATTTVEAGTSTTVPGTTTTSTLPPESLSVETFPVPEGSRPHDVAPAADGGVWYTAQGSGELGWLDPETGETRHIPLGAGSRPHGVIVDDQGTPWITDGGLNNIYSVDPETGQVTVYPIPDDTPGARLNTATFAADGNLWFTGQGGIYGMLDLASGETDLYRAPEGPGPYGITTTPDGIVYYASLAGSYVGRINSDGTVEVIEPPTPDQGARRVWADSTGAIWVSEWNAGNLSRYQPGTGEWATWALPGESPATYAVFVDEDDIVWVSDFGSNSLLRFDPVSQEFHSYPLPHQPGEVRQLHGRPGEVWGAESAADHLVLIRTR
jgi:virginiamycin B lyase